MPRKAFSGTRRRDTGEAGGLEDPTGPSMLRPFVSPLLSSIFYCMTVAQPSRALYSYYLSSLPIKTGLLVCLGMQSFRLCLFSYLFTWLQQALAVCSMQDLRSLLQHVGSLVTACKLLIVACGVQFPDQGSNLRPLRWKRESQPLDPHGSPSVSLNCLFTY